MVLQGWSSCFFSLFFPPLWTLIYTTVKTHGGFADSMCLNLWRSWISESEGRQTYSISFLLSRHLCSTFISYPVHLLRRIVFWQVIKVKLSHLILPPDCQAFSQTTIFNMSYETYMVFGKLKLLKSCSFSGKMMLGDWQLEIWFQNPILKNGRNTRTELNLSGKRHLFQRHAPLTWVNIRHLVSFGTKYH